MKQSLPSLEYLYRQLISCVSISSTNATFDQSNKPLVEQLGIWLESVGFTVNLQSVPNTRHKFNLFASIGEGEGGLLLCGHTDTVPFDEGRWQKDPFTLTEDKGKWYGLGAADMKGFFAFILDAVRDMEAKQFKHPLSILATADEETSMAGARYFAANTTLRPDFAIIGEPTSLQPIHAHKGHLAPTIRIIGKSGHSSDPACGINAIDLMHESITELMKLRKRLQDNYHNPLFAIPYPTMNFGYINGGDAANRICACCELHLDIRPLPELNLNDLEGLFTDALQPVLQAYPGRLTIEQLHPPIPGYQCPTDHHLVAVIEELVGKRAKSVNYCTEAPFIQALCPTLVLGPGSIEQAHQPNEYLDMKFIRPTQAILKQLITHFCF